MGIETAGEEKGEGWREGERGRRRAAKESWQLGRRQQKS